MIREAKVAVAAMVGILLLIVLAVAMQARTKAAFYTRLTGEPMTAWEAFFVEPQFTDNQVRVRP